MCQATLSRFLFVLVLFIGPCFAIPGLNGRNETTSLETTRYLAHLDLEKYKRTGMEPTAPAVSPYRILPTLTEHDRTYHYDFDRLAEVEARLLGVDRRTALKGIFARLTNGTKTHHERHLAVLKFLHQCSFHNLIQPMRPNGQPVYDPLVLLELGEMRCGQVNRIAVDLFRSVGYRARLVQAAFHVLAEIWYEDGWHYFDADIFGNGECPVLPNGRIPSMNELAGCPERLDALTSYCEPDHTNSIRRYGTPYPSYFYFGASAYRDSGVVPEHIEKRASQKQEDTSVDYGWECFARVPDLERVLIHSEVGHSSAPPQINGVQSVEETDKRQVTLSWQADPLAKGYRVFVGRHSRGWNYDGPSLPNELLRWKSQNGPWRAEMYSARFTLPSSDLALVQTCGTKVTVELPLGIPAYFSVMGFDAYGEAIGRKLYPLSEELLVP